MLAVDTLGCGEVEAIYHGFFDLVNKRILIFLLFFEWDFLAGGHNDERLKATTG
jgi:hypothetical protein